MTTKEQVFNFIEDYIKEIGLTKEDTLNPKTNSYVWRRGSALIEVFIQDVQVSSGIRTFLRVFSYMGELPGTLDLERVLRYLLEMNDSSLGLKLTIMPGTNGIYATYERDIRGIDYEELKTCIWDLEWWADIIDDELANKFGVQKK